MENPRVYLSGRFSTGTKIEAAWLKRTGCKYRCFSFANVDKEADIWFAKQAVEALAVCEKKKISIMMDSGAHSFHKFTAQSKRRNKFADEKTEINQEDLKEKMFNLYVDYCLKNKDKWEFYVTLDYKKHQPTILAMQKKFEDKGLRPVPVFHGDTPVEWLSKYRDKGYKLIGIGTSVDFRAAGFKGYRYYLDRVFDYGAKHDIKFHGLALTSLSLMTMYPWWSVDSSTWSKSAVYGCLTFPDREKNIIYNLHISERESKSPIASYNNYSAKQRQAVNATLKAMGFDAKELRHGENATHARHDFNGYVFSNIFDLVDTSRKKHTQWERLV